MGHTERIIAELASLEEADKARVLAYLQQLKSERETEERRRSPMAEEDFAKLRAVFDRYRLRMTGFKFNRDEANER
jgi:hypothetical protein